MINFYSAECDVARNHKNSRFVVHRVHILGLSEQVRLVNTPSIHTLEDPLYCTVEAKHSVSILYSTLNPLIYAFTVEEYLLTFSNSVRAICCHAIGTARTRTIAD